MFENLNGMNSPDNDINSSSKHSGKPKSHSRRRGASRQNEKSNPYGYSLDDEEESLKTVSMDHSASDYDENDGKPSTQSYDSEVNPEDNPEDADGENGLNNDDELEQEYDEEEEEDEDDDEENGRKKASAIRLLFSMMLNPLEGWKSIRRRNLSVDSTSAQCFIPLSTLAAASCFMECAYNSATTLSMAMIEGVKVFVSLFFGNFLGLAIVKMLMPKKYKGITESDFGKKYMMYLMSTLAVFMILYECLPMIGPVIAFTPLWTVYLAMRGAKFFRFPEEKRSLLTSIVCMSVVVSPFVLYWVFDMLLPSVAD